MLHSSLGLHTRRMAARHRRPARGCPAFVEWPSMRCMFVGLSPYDACVASVGPWGQSKGLAVHASGIIMHVPLLLRPSLARPFCLPSTKSCRALKPGTMVRLAGLGPATRGLAVRRSPIAPGSDRSKRARPAQALAVGQAKPGLLDGTLGTPSAQSAPCPGAWRAAPGRTACDRSCQRPATGGSKPGPRP